MASVLKVTNGIIRKSAATLTAASIAVSGFVVWDNYQFYEEVNDLKIALLENKPEAASKDSFDDLLRINSDVIGWITIPETNIDYPILQNKSSTYYLNRDVYKNYSMAGSIYMDSRCSKDFSNAFSIIYGHNMIDHLMFGDLTLFKDESFFNANTDAKILTPDTAYDYKILAVMEENDSEENVFSIEQRENNLDGLADFIQKKSIHYSEKQIEKLKNNPDSMYILSLVTCTTGSTGKRLLVLICREGEKRIQPVTTTTETTITTTETTSSKPIITKITSSYKPITTNKTTETTTSATTSKNTNTTTKTTGTTTSATTSENTNTTTETISPEISVTTSVYYSIEAVPGYYFSHDDGRHGNDEPGGFAKEQITSITKYIITEDGKTSENVDLSGVNYGGETPNSVYTTRFGDMEVNTNPQYSDFVYNVPVYNGDEVLLNQEGKALSVTAYIGVKGDVNLDSIVDGTDASEVLTYYAYASTDGTDKETLQLSSSKWVTSGYDDLDDLAAFLADVDTNEWDEINWSVEKQNRKLDAADASAILTYYGYASAADGKYGDWSSYDLWNEVCPYRFGEG